jgi:hypothetical protein
MSQRRWVVHVASSQMLRRVEAKDGWVDVMGCIRLFYPNFVVFFVLGHKGSLVISFPINITPRAGGEVNKSVISLPPPSHSCFLRCVGVLHGVREEMRESERSFQSSKEWEDVVAVFTPCKHMILSI